MSGRHPEKIREFAASTVFAKLIDDGPGDSVPPKRPPADKAAVDKALTHLQQLGVFTPPTEADTKPLEPVTIFHEESSPPTGPAVPVEAEAAKPAPKGHQPEKIERKWPSDSQSFLEIDNDDHKTWRAWNSQRQHELTLHKQQRRAEQGLPPRKLSFKEMLRTLTLGDVAILEKLGFDVQKVHRGTPSYEIMIRALIQYQKSKKNTSPAFH